jgi:hypothetical protein
MKKVTIDVVTEDPATQEWALYLVEDGPWEANQLEGRLRSLQERIYQAVDVALDGHLANKYPGSRGKKVRIQVDFYDEPPRKVAMVVRAIAEFIRKSPEYRKDIKSSEYIRAIRIVSTLASR